MCKSLKIKYNSIFNTAEKHLTSCNHRFQSVGLSPPQLTSIIFTKHHIVFLLFDVMFCKDDRCEGSLYHFPAVETAGYKMLDVSSALLNQIFILFSVSYIYVKSSEHQ